MLLIIVAAVGRISGGWSTAGLVFIVSAQLNVQRQCRFVVRKCCQELQQMGALQSVLPNCRVSWQTGRTEGLAVLWQGCAVQSTLIETCSKPCACVARATLVGCCCRT